MMESAIMEYVKWWIGLMATFFVIIMVIFMFKLNEVNAFQQEVNYQIERHGGLTTEAMVKLNKHANENYGGYLVKGIDSNEPLFPNSPDNGETSSGFFVKEVVTNGNTKRYYTRGDKQARYATPIEYALVRQIGSLYGFTMKPGVIGESASRVRGED